MSANPWPVLPDLEKDAELIETLHRWAQIVGKIRLAHTPWTNHSWHVPLYLTPCRLTVVLATATLCLSIGGPRAISTRAT